MLDGLRRPGGVPARRRTSTSGSASMFLHAIYRYASRTRPRSGSGLIPFDGFTDLMGRSWSRRSPLPMRRPPKA
ncbi:MAG: hypothetical protein WKF75_18475 [Singulisphaera sp.]